MGILLIAVGAFVLVGLIAGGVLFIIKQADKQDKNRDVDEDRPTQIEG